MTAVPLPLSGRAAFVTGASRGLGMAIAARFAAAGAHVAMIGRDASTLDRAQRAVENARADKAQKIRAFAADVTNEDAMRSALAAFAVHTGPLTVLVNNAAVQGPIGELDRLDWYDWTTALAIDLLAPINLCRLVVPDMRAARYGKIINVSGGGATGPRPRFSAYATAKSGLVRFTETLAAELSGTGVDVNALAPGAMSTKMLDEILDAGPEAAGDEYEQAQRRKALTDDEGDTAPPRAADLAAFLASPQSDGITGRLLSASWDPWETLAARRADLDGSDIYTLRRIGPKDRGLTWGDR